MKSLVIPSIMLISLCNLVCAQYNYQGGSNHASGDYGDAGGGFGDEHNGGMEDRPKVNLGIRLRIPAFKFELPRFSLPKITVSARIRQPEGPRIIQLPEINLDTSSKSELPGNKGSAGGGGSGGGGGGGYSNHYQSSTYGMGASSSYGGQTGMISFSTEDATPAHYDYQKTMAYKTAQPTHGAAYGQPQQPSYSYQPQYRRPQPSYTSASNVLPIYWANNGNSAPIQSTDQYRFQLHDRTLNQNQHEGRSQIASHPAGHSQSS